MKPTLSDENQLIDGTNWKWKSPQVKKYTVLDRYAAVRKKRSCWRCLQKAAENWKSLRAIEKDVPKSTFVCWTQNTKWMKSSTEIKTHVKNIQIVFKFFTSQQRVIDLRVQMKLRTSCNYLLVNIARIGGTKDLRTVSNFPQLKNHIHRCSCMRCFWSRQFVWEM